MTRLTSIHSIREALNAGRPLDRILIARGRGGDRLQELIMLARERGVPLRFENRDVLDRAAGGQNHQGVVAFAAARGAAPLDGLIRQTQEPSGLLVLLDGVEDPHNLGAIVRSALAAGADGIVIPERRAVGLTESVATASAGALEHLPVARVGNLAQAMEELKEAGYWLVGLDERAPKTYTDVDLTGRIGLVLGGEGRGLHDLVRKRCDFLVCIPTCGPVRSLNVSVAAGVVLFEAVRQRNARQKP